MTMVPVAVFRSPVSGKFGLPRQAGLAANLKGQVVLEAEFRHPDALRGLEGFDYIWLVWGFSLNERQESGPHSTAKMTVRPPRLGGNTRVGVFASRSPFRPNGLGLSSVKIESIDFEKGMINVLGADLADGTPIYDIKPYVTYTDSHPDARSGFVDSNEWQRLEVRIPETLSRELGPELSASLIEVLAEDPRPQYRKGDADKTYGLTFAGRDIRFTVKDMTAVVTDPAAGEPKS